MDLNYTFKELSDVDIAESIANESNVLIEENGVIKKTSASAIGKVKTVNGEEPDENGNIEVEIPEGFSGSWNDLKDKPFGEEEKPEEICIYRNVYVGWWEPETFERTGTLWFGITGSTNKAIYNVYHKGVKYENINVQGLDSNIAWVGNSNLLTNEIKTSFFVDEESVYGDLPFVIYQTYNSANESHNNIESICDSKSMGDTIELIYLGDMKTFCTPLDEKYIPNNIPKIQSATVGRTLVVKAVDENGKPTEWECVDAGGNDTNLPFTVISVDTHPEYFYQGICDLRLLPYFNCYLIKSLRLKYGDGINDYLDCGTTRYNDHGAFLVTSLSQTFYFLSTAIHFNSNGDKSIVYRLSLDNNREYQNLEYASLTTTYGKI